MQTLHDQAVLILGLGASGLAMARWCTRCGAQVTVADTRSAPPQLATLRAELPKVRFIAGPLEPALLADQSYRALYRSPGLAPATVAALVDAARAQGLEIGGELSLFAQALRALAQPPVVDEVSEPAVSELSEASEVSTAAASEPLAYADPEPAPVIESPESSKPPEGPVEAEAEPAPVAPPAPNPGYTPKVLAITGTNGKTTVTSLTGQLVARAGKSVAVAGNIGPTLLDTLSAHLDAGTLPEVWVLELSSFQLHDAGEFEPTAATVLNVTQDHLDWHGDLQAYAADKARVFGAKGLLLLNREDPLVMAMRPAPPKPAKGQRAAEAARLARPVLTFGGDMPQRPGDFGIETVNGMAWLVRAYEADETRRTRRQRSEEVEELYLQRLMPADALRIRGRHNAVNALAALALTAAAGCALGPALYALRDYRGEPHRVESVGLLNGVEYFDDSKGTNVGATVAALKGLGDDSPGQRRLLVILGGDGKGQDFSPLAAPVAQYVRSVFLIGRDAALIRQALAGTGVPLLDADSLEQAVRLAAAQAESGDKVLMSPACASLDMFENYAHRARVFCETVQALALEAGQTLELGA